MQLPASAKPKKSKLGGNGVVNASADHLKALQAGVDSLMQRLLALTNNFKTFLIEHQRIVSKQEKRKEKLIGPQGHNKQNQFASLRKQRILPQHQSQQASRESASLLTGSDL